MKGECTPEESAFVEEWYDNMGRTENVMSPETVASAENRLWNKLRPGSSNSSSNVRVLTFVKVAAALMIMLSAGWVFIGNYQKNHTKEYAKETIVAPGNLVSHVSNTTDKPLTVELKDGSKIILQANSEISFDENFSGAKREVFLQGEAFFDVKRDEQRPFLVYSKELVTKVLGTSFNIKAYDIDKEITVAVKTGKVSVYHTPEGQEQTAEEKEAVILKPNQQAVYDKANEIVVKQLVEKPEIVLPDSRLFRMSFEEQPVAGIFDLLEEHYGVDIVYDEEALKRCTLTTAMSEEGLYQRIEVICKAIKAKYTVTEGMIFIESPGCN